MEQVKHSQRTYGRDYRRELRRERRQRRSTNLQRKYSFRGVEGAIIVAAVMVGVGYITWTGLTYLLDFFGFLLKINASGTTPLH